MQDIRIWIAAGGVLVSLISLLLGFEQRRRHERLLNKNFQFYIRQQRQLLDQVGTIETFASSMQPPNPNLANQISQLKAQIEDSAYGDLQIDRAIWKPKTYRWYKIWEANKAWNVAPKLAREIKNGRLHVQAHIQILGEPAPNVHKVLDVFYSVGGEKMQRRVEEDQYLNLP
jgi:hypothetical protein